MERLDAAQTARHLPYARLVPEIARAARELAAGALTAPDRLVVGLGDSASLLCMPAVGPDIGVVKFVTVHPQNTEGSELPAIQGEVIVFEARTGRRRLLLDGPTVTARRTAAVSLLGIELLAARPPSSALLIGPGVQAMAHAEALFEYFGVRSFWIAGRDAGRTERFCQMLCDRHAGIRAVPVSAPSLEPTGAGTDVVIALTTSRTPVVPPRLPDETLAIGVGAYRPEMAELPAELLRGRRIVVDHRDGARHEAGDLLRAAVDWSKVREIGELLDQDRSRERVPSVFKTVGQASWDLAAARVALDART